MARIGSLQKRSRIDFAEDGRCRESLRHHLIRRTELEARGKVEVHRAVGRSGAHTDKSNGLAEEW
jgi:hypothetical protein